MIVKDIPKCLSLVVDTTKSGNVGVCPKAAAWGITLKDGKVYTCCWDCMTRRLTIIGTAIDTATIVFYIKK